jgi:NAD(P)-dependent dehydrogenase (short-subunit alcohol dehydrogenase family)
MSRVILITGAAKGFGKIWAEAFLKNGYRVVATGRNTEAFQELSAEYGEQVLALRLDVNDRNQCFEAVDAAKEHFGRIDILINNAGYGLFGAVEETTEQEARNQMETNFFGVLWMTQAVLPVMRAQQSGHIIQVSSYLGLVTVPILGVYNASKFAVEGLSETLATEVKALGINISLVEPNGYSTSWSAGSAVQTKAMEVYEPVKAALQEAISVPGLFGKPEATVEAMLKLLESPEPPLRLLLGSFAYPTVKQAYEERLASFEEWKEVSVAAHGN